MDAATTRRFFELAYEEYDRKLHAGEPLTPVRAQAKVSGVYGETDSILAAGDVEPDHPVATDTPASAPPPAYNPYAAAVDSQAPQRRRQGADNPGRQRRDAEFGLRLVCLCALADVFACLNLRDCRAHTVLQSHGVEQSKAVHRCSKAAALKSSAYQAATKTQSGDIRRQPRRRRSTARETQKR